MGEQALLLVLRAAERRQGVRVLRSETVDLRDGVECVISPVLDGSNGSGDKWQVAATRDALKGMRFGLRVLPRLSADGRYVTVSYTLTHARAVAHEGDGDWGLPPPPPEWVEDILESATLTVPHHATLLFSFWNWHRCHDVLLYLDVKAAPH